MAGVMLREAVVNNKFCPGYMPYMPQTSLLYFDDTNLYGWGMSQDLPYGAFKWVLKMRLRMSMPI